ncbi:MAG: ParB/RepB/Spo0J family partition protein [Bdellovibrionales bacterium]|nr:ParB/RepB/Spo0J family partition protein [Bdellovibrionales bacterium]
MGENENPKVRLVANRSHGQLERALGNLMGMQSSAVNVRDVELRPEIPSTNVGPDEENISGPTLLPLQQIAESAKPLREEFNQTGLEELAASIRTKGVIQPILVRRTSADGKLFQLVAGERRLKAAQLASLEQIPAIVGDFSDREALEIALVENAQREDLNAIDEAAALQRLSEEFSLSHGEIAEALGKSRAAVANAVRLLSLEPEIINLVRKNELSAGHARALLGIKDIELRIELALQAAREGWSVRMVEDAVRHISSPVEDEDELAPEDSDETVQIARLKAKVEKLLGLEVALSLDKQGRKRLQITFPNETAWKRFVSRIRA